MSQIRSPAHKPRYSRGRQTGSCRRLAEACYEIARRGTQAEILPCREGTYCDRGTKDEFAAVECPKGFYCPPESSIPIPCQAGKLCTTTSLEEPNEKCPKGMYCELGGYENSLSDGRQCPAGAYCPEASPSPLLCPIGTRSEALGAASEAECTACPAGR